MKEVEDYDLIITSKKSLFHLDLKRVWKYRDLLFLFIKRDFVSVYKQTILGPLWFFIQPILTTITFTVVFGKIANIPTEGIPSLIYYMSGITLWGYFSDCVNKTSGTFIANQGIFGKVFFPRLIVPLADIITNLLKFGIQILMFFGFYIYYYFTVGLEPNLTLLLLPILVLIMALMSMGIGMIITAMTTKYRDLTFLVRFGVQLLMYLSPIIYSMDSVPPQFARIIALNPMSGVINNFKYGCFSTGQFDSFGMIYSSIFAVIILLIGTVVFNRVQKSFIDTV